MMVDRAALTPDEIDTLRSDLADYYEKEIRRHEADDARNELEAECRAIKRRLRNDVASHLSFPDKGGKGHTVRVRSADL